MLENAIHTLCNQLSYMQHQFWSRSLSVCALGSLTVKIDRLKTLPWLFEQMASPEPLHKKGKFQHSSAVEKTAPFLHFGAMDNQLRDSVPADDELWKFARALMVKVAKREKVTMLEFTELVQKRIARHAKIAEGLLLNRFKKMLENEHLASRAEAWLKEQIDKGLGIKSLEEFLAASCPVGVKFETWKRGTDLACACAVKGVLPAAFKPVEVLEAERMAKVAKVAAEQASLAVSERDKELAMVRAQTIGLCAAAATLRTGRGARGGRGVRLETRPRALCDLPDRYVLRLGTRSCVHDTLCVSHVLYFCVCHTLYFLCGFGRRVMAQRLPAEHALLYRPCLPPTCLGHRRVQSWAHARIDSSKPL